LELLVLFEPLPGGRGQPLAVRAERHAVHLARVVLDGQQVLAAGRIPDLDRLVPTRRRQAGAVLVVGETEHPVLVPLEGELRRDGGLGLLLRLLLLGLFLFGFFLLGFLFLLALLLLGLLFLVAFLLFGLFLF